MSLGTLAPRERKSTRLAGFDYSSRRWYFVTAVSRHRSPVFGSLAAQGIRLSEVGRIVEEEWQRSSRLRGDAYLDAFIVMPDHIHGLVGLLDAVTSASRSSLTSFMGAFKAAVTRRVHSLFPGRYGALWQRSFHDSIIRNPRHLAHVRGYIEANPRKAWERRGKSR